MWKDDLFEFLEYLNKIENKEELKRAKADEKLEK